MVRLPAWSVDRPGQTAMPRPSATAPLAAAPRTGRAGLWAGWLARRLAPLAPPSPSLAGTAR